MQITMQTPARWLPPFNRSFGNPVIDRIFRNGEVVDFMNIGMPWGPFQIRSGIFNIADVAIMAGLFLMIGVELFLPAKSAAPGEAKVLEKDAG